MKDSGSNVGERTRGDGRGRDDHREGSKQRVARPDRVALAGQLAVLIAIGGALLAIHVLVPSPHRDALAFDHADPAPITALSAAYVHASWSHLLGNLVGLGVAGGTAALLCSAHPPFVARARTRWFHVTTATFLVALPVLVTVTGWLTFRAMGHAPTGRGFSGVVAGYAGFTLVALARGLADRYGARLAYDVGTGVLLVVLGEVLVIYDGTPDGLTAALLAIGLWFTLGRVARRGLRGIRGTREESGAWSAATRRTVGGDAVFAGAVVAILLALVWVLFPSSLGQGDGVTNVLGHAAGLIWGGFLALATLTVTSRHPGSSR